jgi:hypothetical protein
MSKIMGFDPDPKTVVTGRRHEVKNSVGIIEASPKTSISPLSSPQKAKARDFRGLLPVFCGPEGIQTPNLLIRSQMLYSVELRNHFFL